METTTTKSKTKSGKEVNVAIIPDSLVMSEGPERAHWRATEIAQQNNCTHYRVVSSTGAILLIGKAGALPTEAQTARTHGC